MALTIINGADSIERQNEKLLKIAEVLMNRVEQVTNDGGAAYEQFQRAVMLEDQVRARTQDLEAALGLLNESNAQLSEAMRAAQASRKTLADAIETIREGFGLFDDAEKLVLCNSRFGMFMPDIRHLLRPGLDFSHYIELASQSRHLILPRGVTASQWAERRLHRHHQDHVVFNIEFDSDHWMQVSEHRTGNRQTVVLQTDVTEIMRAERQERSRIVDDQAQRISGTLEHIEQGVAVFDAAGALVGWNNRVSEMLGLPMSILRSGTPYHVLLDELAHLRSARLTPDRIANWVETKGERAPFSDELTRAPDVVLKIEARDMHDRGFVVSFTDISAERKAAEDLRRAKESLERRVVERTLELEDALAAAERANASKARFVAAASHDLMQPLSAAKLFISSLGDTGEPERRDLLAGKASTALESIESMIGSLLTISKLDTVNEQFDIRPVSLSMLLEQLAAEFAPLAQAKGLTFRVCASSLWVQSDPTYFRRIVQNLIANAIRYTPKGKVLVGVRRRGGTARIEVHDTGPGIAEESQEAIFEAFCRLGKQSSASEGLGLGLAIVERSCALLGHPLDLRSQLDQGSCFTLTAKVTDAPGAGMADGRAQGGATLVAAHLVLVVEDDAEMRDAIEVALSAKGHHIIVSDSIPAALELLSELDLRPDCALLDYQFGEGCTVFDELEALRAALPGLPMTIFSANRTAELTERCARERLALLHKPASVEALEAAILSAGVLVKN